jgi:outer membrane protein assembly factor BamB
VWTSLSCGGDFGYCPPMIDTFGTHRQLIIWSSEAVSGLDPATGKKLWDVDFKVKAALTAPTPRKVGDDKLLVSSFYNGSRLLQIAGDGNSATVVWQGKANSEAPTRTDGLHSIMVTPTIRGDTIYGVCSYGQLRALDAKSGKRLWECMDATRGRKTAEDARTSSTPTKDERWSNAFIVANGDRFFLFNEQGELIIAKLTPGGYTEIDRAVILEPTNMMAGRPTVWVHPAFANRAMYARNDKEIVAVDLAR